MAMNLKHKIDWKKQIIEEHRRNDFIYINCRTRQNYLHWDKFICGKIIQKAWKDEHHPTWWRDAAGEGMWGLATPVSFYFWTGQWVQSSSVIMSP